MWDGQSTKNICKGERVFTSIIIIIAIIIIIIIVIKLARLKGYSPPSRGLTGNCKFAIPTILCGGKIDH